MIREKKGMERIKVFWTGLRQYRCRACDDIFRAMDRRRIPRHVPDAKHAHATNRQLA